MVSRARVKRLAVGLDRRFPLFRDLLRRSSLLRRLLRLSRLVPPRMLRTHVGFFPLAPTNGLPKFLKFAAPPRGRRIRLLFGISHDHPSLHRMQCSMVFGDERDEVVLRLKPRFLTQSPVDPPWAARALLPHCVYWYELQVSELPQAWHTLNARFKALGTLPEPADLPPGFRFHGLLAYATDDDASDWLVELRHAGPYALGTMRAEA